MKSLKLIVASLLLAGAFASQASAQTTVRITGSTAFRQATHQAILKIFAPGYTYAYTGTNYNGARAAIIKGQVGGKDVVVKTSWSGSTGGIQTVSNSLPVRFLVDSTATSTGGTSGVADPTAGSNENDSSIPDVNMADSFQNATPFVSTTLVDQPVGVIGFKWVASNGAPANLTNVTPLLAQALWGNGSMSLALFSGSSADEGTKVYATGRDFDSGTRTVTFQESGIGANSVVTQYKPNISSNAVTGYSPYPAQTINGISFPAGQGGESSGGTLATNLTATTNASVGFSIGYLSATGDAVTALSGGAKELTWNGFTYSTAAVTSGQYTFWSYEHLDYRPTLSGVAKTVADTLAQQIITVDAPIKLSEMRVSRPADGGLVTQNY